MFAYFKHILGGDNSPKNDGPESDENWKKWEGQVLGSKEDIKEALRRLNGTPKNVEELQTIISTIRKEENSQTAEDSKNCYY